MAKEKTVYVCTNCGQESPKWAGKCPSCGQWNTFVEEVVRKEAPVAKHVAHGIESVRSKPQRLTEIESNEEQRMDMLDEELNRVLGGGLVQGSLTLIGGEPGIGKSTLILQTVLRLTHKRILYVSGEESARQLKLRAVRIPHPENDNLLIACETSLEQIFTHIKNAAPDLVIIDSIQTISTENIDSSPGSIVQVRECTASLLKFAKETGTTGDLRNATGRTTAGEQPFRTVAYPRPRRHERCRHCRCRGRCTFLPDRSTSIGQHSRIRNATAFRHRIRPPTHEHAISRT